MIERTVSRFMRYADCASESHHERAFCECMEQELRELGIPFERQELNGHVVTDGWNILARVPGSLEKQPLLLVFHLDTAEQTASWPSRWPWKHFVSFRRKEH